MQASVRKREEESSRREVVFNSPFEESKKSSGSVEGRSTLNECLMKVTAEEKKEVEARISMRRSDQRGEEKGG